MDDGALVARALAGGPAAFGPLIERYKDVVFGVALARLRNYEDAEDVTQGVFLEAFGRLDGLRDADRLGAWLRSIAIHRAVDHQRRGSRIVELDDAAEPLVERSTPHTELERLELRERMMAAIGRLSKVQRETVTMFYISGYSRKEIARIQEVPLNTVKYRLYEARIRLKEDVMDMVGDVLRDSAPGKDFTDRVFQLLCAYPEGGRLWATDAKEALSEIGLAGLKGFEKALDLRHWKTRRAAAFYLGWMPPDREVINLMKRGLKDTNQKVRKTTVGAMVAMLDVSESRRREEVVPLLIPLLFDPSKRVRHFTVGMLNWRGGTAVPLETVARALVQEEDFEVRDRLIRLMGKVLEGQEAEAGG
jgi:RNA polymerase sigma-70 factor, ECF subfamily